ncbi:MAG TPA: T9SS type A sorting domain-containing protein [Chitinophagaceae bacterium]|nr:T9SS type A sorting domain-containing protein [Chitinophagaceae bacterium]
MKKSLLSISLFFSISFFANSAIIWDGEGGDGLWSTNTNWVGDIVPGASDDVILDNSIVNGGYTVSLPAGNVSISVNSLTITPTGSNSITFIIPAVNTASPVFTVSGPGEGLILNKGSVLKNSSGAVSGSTLVITNTFRINNGARYVHNTARGNASIVSQLSTAAGTEEGEIEFDVPASVQTLSLTGRTYGTLILSSITKGGPVTYSGNGASNLNIKGNLQINAGVTFSTGMSANIIIHKKLIQAATSVFNLQNSTHNNSIKIHGDVENQGTITKTGSGIPVLELNGTANQNIAVTNAIVGNITLKVNNSTGVTLFSPLVIPGKLELTNGKVKTNGTNILTLTDGAFHTGGSSISFVEGPIKKIGDDDFNFPVGSGDIYAPIGIAGGGGNVTDEFIAEYKRQNPQSTPGLGNTIENTINHISSVEYWEITRSAGSSAKNIHLTITEYSFAKNLNTLLAARFEGGQWRNEGGVNFVPGPSVPPYITGTFESNNNVGNFGAFTVGTTDNFILNPLPVKLISFNAFKTTDNKTMLNWELTEHCLPGVIFELQKSTDARVFETIAIVEGNENFKQYEFTDNNLKGGINYYRLKIKDENGMISYSNVASVFNGKHRTLLTVLSPAIVNNSVMLTVSTDSDQQLDLVIFDIHGRIAKKQYQRVNNGNTVINLSVNGFQNGIYYVCLTNNQGFRSVTSFIKQ